MELLGHCAQIRTNGELLALTNEVVATDRGFLVCIQLFAFCRFFRVIRCVSLGLLKASNFRDKFIYKGTTKSCLISR